MKFIPSPLEILALPISILLFSLDFKKGTCRKTSRKNTLRRVHAANSSEQLQNKVCTYMIPISIRGCFSLRLCLMFIYLIGQTEYYQMHCIYTAL